MTKKEFFILHPGTLVAFSDPSLGGAEVPVLLVSRIRRSHTNERGWLAVWPGKNRVRDEVGTTEMWSSAGIDWGRFRMLHGGETLE